MTKKSVFWLVTTIILIVAGLFISFFGLMMVGAGVSGSGCGEQCTNNSHSTLVIGTLFVGGALLTGLHTVIISWSRKGQVIITGLGGLSVIVAILSLLILRIYAKC